MFMEDLLASVNGALSNDFIRSFLIVVTGVFAGYTLQPVPEWLNNLFDTSHLFKFIVIMIIGMTVLYPLDTPKMASVVGVSALTLLVFFLARRFDEKPAAKSSAQISQSSSSLSPSLSAM